MMADDKGKHEEARAAAEKEPRRRKEQGRLIRGLRDAAVSLAMIPVNLLPEESRGHVQAAGRELALGVAAAVRAVADGLEKMAREGEKRSA